MAEGSEMFVDSLRRRIQVMNSLWQRAASDLMLDQVNHVERPGVLPLAFSFNHFMRGAALLTEVAISKLRGSWEKIFCAMVVGPDAPVRKLEVLECFVYQHGLRHMGEVDLGRALVGLPGGMTA